MESVCIQKPKVDTDTKRAQTSAGKGRGVRGSGTLDSALPLEGSSYAGSTQVTAWLAQSPRKTRLHAFQADSPGRAPHHFTYAY